MVWTCVEVDVVGILAYAVVIFIVGSLMWAFNVWMNGRLNTRIIRLQAEIDEQHLELKAAKHREHTWKYRLKRREVPQDLEPMPDEYIDPEEEPSEQLSDLADKVGIRIPEWLRPIINNETVQARIMEEATKHPDLVAGLLDRFTVKQPALPVGKATNTEQSNLA